MPKDTGLYGMRRLYKHLDNAAKDKALLKSQLIPAKYQAMTAEELFQQFLTVRPESKGMLSSGYGARGRKFELTFYFDFGNLWLPGIFKLPIEVSGSVTKLDFAMLVIHHAMPKLIIDPPATAPTNDDNENPATITISSQAPPTVSLPKWKTEKPVSFVALLGKSWEFEVALSLSAFWYLEPPDLWSAKAGKFDANSSDDDDKKGFVAFCELPLAASIGANVEVSKSLQMMKLRDPNPAWYPNASSQELLDDFRRVLGDKGKKQLKLEIKQWIDKFMVVFEPVIFNDKIKKQRYDDYQKLRQDFIAFQRKRLMKARDIAINGPSTLDGIISDVKKIGAEVAKPVHAYKFVKAIGHYVREKLDTTQELLDALESCRKLMPDKSEVAHLLDVVAPTNDRPMTYNTQGNYVIDESKLRLFRRNEISKIQTAIDGLNLKIVDFKQRLQQLKDIENSGTPNSLPVRTGIPTYTLPQHPFLCYLKMVSSTNSGSAQVAAELGPLLGKIGGKMERKFSAYRYQTFAKNQYSSKQLIFTQDTVIKYSQVLFTAGASVAWAGPEAVGEKVMCNGISYRSSSIYWVYPEQAARLPKVKAESGSGVSFGNTIFIADLKGAAMEAATNKLDKYKRIVRKIAAALRITTELLQKFLRTFHQAQRTPGALEGLENHKALLIEANFSLPENSRLDTIIKEKKKKEDGSTISIVELESTFDNSKIQALRGIKSRNKEQTTISNFLADLNDSTTSKATCAQHISSIRLRARMADDSESSFEFKLGSYTGVQTSSITLAAINKAGTEGVLDILVVDFNRPLPPDGPVTEAGITSTTTTTTSTATTRATKLAARQVTPDRLEDFNERAVPPVALLHQ